MAVKKPKTRTARVVEMSEHLGVAQQSIRNWMRLPDWPGDADGSVALDDLSVWRYLRESGENLGDPEELSGPDSPALERYRLARAQLAEHELEQKRKNFLPLEDIHTLLGELASILRNTGERLQKQFGNDALDILEEGLNNFEKRTTERLAGEYGDRDNATGDGPATGE